MAVETTGDEAAAVKVDQRETGCGGASGHRDIETERDVAVGAGDPTVDDVRDRFLRDPEGRERVLLLPHPRDLVDQRWAGAAVGSLRAPVRSASRNGTTCGSSGVIAASSGIGRVEASIAAFAVPILHSMSRPIVMLSGGSPRPRRRRGDPRSSLS